MVANVEGTIKIPRRGIEVSTLLPYTYLSPSYSGVPITVINYYKTREEYWLPRNLKKFKEVLPQATLKYSLVATPEITITTKEGFALFPHQQLVHDKVLEHFKEDINCLLQAPTRFGKTATATALIKSLGVRTLILVDKTLLVNQFISDSRQYTNLDIGQLNEEPLHDVTITTFQYLNSNPDILKKINKSFGLVIVDELHVSAAVTYKRIISSFPSRYRLGMTATPSRSSDNLSGVLYDLFGEIAVIGVNPTDMEVSWCTYRLATHYNTDPDFPAKAYNKYFLAQNQMLEIVAIIEEHKDKTIMIATQSKKVQEQYTSFLSELGMTTCIFNSDSTNKKHQTTNMEKVNSGTITVFAGLNVLLKGVSIPRLEVVINLMAVGSVENLTQLVGRLKTKHENKGTPLFINITGKYGNYKSDKITTLLQEMENVNEQTNNTTTC